MVYPARASDLNPKSRDDAPNDNRRTSNEANRFVYTSLMNSRFGLIRVDDSSSIAASVTASNVRSGNRVALTHREAKRLSSNRQRLSYEVFHELNVR